MTEMDDELEQVDESGTATEVLPSTGTALLSPESPGGDLRPSAATVPIDPSPSVAPPPTITYVYALGRVEARFPTLAVEKEFAQEAGRDSTAGLTDSQMMHSVLTNRENRYLARQLCWVLTVEGMETYLLHP